MQTDVRANTEGNLKLRNELYIYNSLNGVLKHGIVYHYEGLNRTSLTQEKLPDLDLNRRNFIHVLSYRTNCWSGYLVNFFWIRLFILVVNFKESSGIKY